MKISRERATIGGATALVTASFGVGYAFSPPSQGAKAASPAVALKPEVRTQNIHRTVRVVRRRKPLPQGGTGGGAQAATKRRTAPSRPVVRAAVLSGGAGAPAAYAATAPTNKSYAKPTVRTKTSGAPAPGTTKHHGRKHHGKKPPVCTRTSGSPPPSNGPVTSGSPPPSNGPVTSGSPPPSNGPVATGSPPPSNASPTPAVTMQKKKKPCTPARPGGERGDGENDGKGGD